MVFVVICMLLVSTTFEWHESHKNIPLLHWILVEFKFGFFYFDSFGVKNKLLANNNNIFYFQNNILIWFVCINQDYVTHTSTYFIFFYEKV